jgi:hypothetical protein
LTQKVHKNLEKVSKTKNAKGLEDLEKVSKDLEKVSKTKNAKGSEDLEKVSKNEKRKRFGRLGKSFKNLGKSFEKRKTQKVRKTWKKFQKTKNAKGSEDLEKVSKTKNAKGWRDTAKKKGRATDGRTRPPLAPRAGTAGGPPLEKGSLRPTPPPFVRSFLPRGRLV